MQKPDNHAVRQFYLDQLNRNTPAGAPHQPIGVGALVGQSFSMMLRHPLPVLGPAFLVSLLAILLTGVLAGFEAALDLGEQAFGETSFFADLTSALFDLAAFAIIAAFLAQLAHDARLDRALRLRDYIPPTLAAAFPIVFLNGFLAFVFVLTLVPAFLAGLFTLSMTMTVIFGIGALVLGLWGYSVFAVMPPSVVIERAGFRGLHRSAALTKSYRWPVAFAILLVWLCSVALALAAAYPVEMLMAMETPAGLGAAVMLYSAVNAFGVSLLSILTALIYARLREIKEGVGLDRVASVFD